MRFLWVFLLALSSTFDVHATAISKLTSKVVEKKKPAVLQLDSSKVELRRFNEQTIAKYSKQKEFIYDDVTPKGLSWWDRFWRWIWHIIEKIFSGGGTSTGISKLIFVVLKWVLIAAMVVGIVFIIIKILGLDLKVLSGKSKNVEVPYEESLENIHEINFDEQIENSLQNSNYRLAVRLLYLKTLKQLSDRQLINWQVEKTNQTYVLEIEDQVIKQEFANITNQFEYIWYGEFFIDKSTFELVNQSFVQFNQHTR
jgi:hypothetical protein